MQQPEAPPAGDSKTPAVWAGCGRRQAAAGELEGAVASFTAAIGLLRPCQARATATAEALAHALTERGICHYELGHVAEAIADFAAVPRGVASHPVAAENRRKAEGWRNQRFWECAVAGLEGEVGTRQSLAEAEAERAEMLTMQALALSPLRVYRTQSLPRRRGVPCNPLHSVHCARWLDTLTCAAVLAAAEAHAASLGGWGALPARHRTHATVDVELSTVPALRGWMAAALRDALLPALADCFAIPARRMRVREVFLIRYTADAGGQAGLALHRDAALLSFRYPPAAPRAAAPPRPAAPVVA
jgi:hypothetical protein